MPLPGAPQEQHAQCRATGTPGVKALERKTSETSERVHIFFGDNLGDIQHVFAVCFFLRDTSSVWYLFSALHFGMLICHDCHVLRIILQYVCDHSTSNHSNNRNLEGIYFGSCHSTLTVTLYLRLVRHPSQQIARLILFPLALWDTVASKV